MPLSELPGIRHVLGRRGVDDVERRPGSGPGSGRTPGGEPETTLESMFAYQAERELAASLPPQRRRAAPPTS